MICPKCHREFQEEFTRCSNCDVQLIKESLQELDPNSQEIVPIFKPQNESEYFILSTLLEENGIPFYAKNTKVQNLFGVGQIGSYHNIITGPITILINKAYADQAKLVIDEYQKNRNKKVESESENNYSKFHKYLTNSIIAGLFLPGSGLYFLIRAIFLLIESKEELYFNFRFYFSLVFNLLGLSSFLLLIIQLL